MPHHPASVPPNVIQPPPNTASFPDGPPMAATAPPSGSRPGQASGAYHDLLGLESELTSIQVYSQTKFSTDYHELKKEYSMQKDGLFKI